MSENFNKNSHNNVNQEIDLTLLSKSLGNFIDNIGFTIYRILNFFLKNVLIVIILTLAGLVLGWYNYINDKKAYRNEIIVVANFNSTEYMYDKVRNFSAETSEKLPVLNEISGLKIEPIVNVFEFTSNEKNNLEIAKYMSENTIEVSKFKKDNNVEKLYKYHKLSYYSKIFDKNERIYQALLNDLNNDNYLIERQKIEQQNTIEHIAQLEKSIENIDQIFKKLGNASSGNELNVQMYAQINDLMLTKQDLVKKINQNKVALLEENKIIFGTSKVLNIDNKNIFKILYPVILLNFLFLLVGICVKLFKKYKFRNSLIHENSNAI